jgi:DNA-binding response OmpR family regulator
MKGKILIVHPDSETGDLIRTWLSEAGFESAYVSDGEAALKEASRFAPDVIISDTLMPHTDGFELHRRLRRMPETAAVPVVFLWSGEEIPFQLKGLRLGGDDYICKPFEREALFEALERAAEGAAKVKAFYFRSEFHGDLAETGLYDLMQIAEMNCKTGEFVLQNTRAETVGVLCFSEGRLVGSTAQDLSGEEAFYALLDCFEGNFSFYEKKSDCSEQISLTNAAILAKACRLLEEEQILKARVPVYDVFLEINIRQIPPELITDAGQENLQKLLSMIYKKQTVREILRTCGKSGMSRLTAASVLLHLMDAGLLTVREQASRSEPRRGTQPPVDRNLENTLRDFERRGLTGILEITGGSARAALFFQDGVPVHAYHGKTRGKKAVYRIFSEKNRILHFKPQPVVIHHSIDDSLEQLLEEGSRETEAFQRLKKDLFDNPVAVHTPTMNEASIIRNIPDMEYVLSLAHQHDSLREIIEASQLTDLQTYKYMIYMDKIGVITLETRGGQREDFLKTELPKITLSDNKL